MGRRPAGIIAAAKQAFLERFAVTGIITDAVLSAGIGSRDTIRYWREHATEFAAAYRQAEQTAIEVLEKRA
jgi:hypothetical protein